MFLKKFSRFRFCFFVFFGFEKCFDSEIFFLKIELFYFDFEELFVARFGFCTISYIMVA